MAPSISPDFSKIVGLPYEKMNCWDAAREFYQSVFGIELRHYFDELPTDRETTRALIYTHRGDFEKVEGAPLFGDLLLFTIRGIESHIGVALEPGRFFHSSKTTGSCIDRMDKWKHLLTGMYRHKPLEGNP